MKSSVTRTLACLLAIPCFFSTANASSMLLTPAYTSASPSEAVAFEVWMDFEETTIGGNFSIWFDPAVLAFESWLFADIGEPAFQGEPAVFTDRLYAIGFGDFTSGITGPNLVGTVEFNILPNAPLGTSSLDLNQVDCFQCEFVNMDTFQAILPEFTGADIQVVPLPATAWLLAAALAALAARSR